MFGYLAVAIFLLAFVFIVFEIFDKSLVAMFGALMMIVFGLLTPEEALAAIDFETIILLMAMMILVGIASKSGIFEWLNIKIAAYTKGNPLALFFLFSLVTALFSAFLDNVTTVILVAPITIELMKGMGKDPKPYLFAEILFSNIGGALTLIGDPPNIIIAGATGLNFVEFLLNLWIPISAAIVFTLLVFVLFNWKSLRPISKNMRDLLIANVLIRKIKQQFLRITIHREFVAKVVLVLFLTIFGFVMQSYIGLPNYVIAFVAAIALAIITSKRINIHETFNSVEWTTLFFFAGLFVLVGGVEKTGLLEKISHMIVNSTDNILILSLIVLWASGLLSMILDNIPFVTVMIPVIVGIQAQFIAQDTTILWWALSLGACLGGNGSLIGASANVVVAGIAKKHDHKITFLEYFKFGFPITIGILILCSIYLFVRINYL